MQTLLGIETSCDETAAAVVTDDGRIHANIVSSQWALHRQHGGVVPEIAARSHLSHIDGVIREALGAAGITPDRLDGVAATAGPGLIGGVLVGATTAKALAFGLNIPFYAINHLEGHALSVRLTEGVDFPYLLLLVSGGHTQLLEVRGVGDYHRLGTTLDDAAGEAFDKSAKLMGLDMPGGPAIEAAAKNGNPQAFALPRPLMHQADCAFSFSGLKTAVLTVWRKAVADNPDEAASDKIRADLAAALQLAIAETLAQKSATAMDIFRRNHPNHTTPDFVVAGGVAANRTIRARLMGKAADKGFNFTAPPLELCTDNGAMIAWAGLERINSGFVPSPLDFDPRPRWSLEVGN